MNSSQEPRAKSKEPRTTRLLWVCALAGVLLCVRFLPDWLGLVGPAHKGLSRRVLLAGVLLALTLFVAQKVWHPFVRGMVFTKNCFLLGLGFSGAVMIFLLPPFQGPDENAHWRTALDLCRAGADDAPVLSELPAVLGAEVIPFHAENHFAPKKFRAPGAPLPDTHRVSYAGYLSYPLVTFVSLFFPRVQTVQEALLFYYLCRLAPYLLLLLLLYWGNRMCELPYTALVFFSLPLVMQQFTTVTRDVLLNLGTVLAVLLFIRLRRRPARWLYLALWALCLLLARTKPMDAGLLLLPLVLFPFRKVPYRRVLLPLLALLALGAFYCVAQVGINELRKSGGRFDTETVDAQLAALRTGAGWRMFFSDWFAFVSQFWDVRAWTAYLGWLDTPLNPHHLFLISLSAGLALALDAWRYGPCLPEILRKRKREVTLVAAVAAANFLFLTLAVCAILYLSWTTPGNTQIMGLQARYVFPAGILALLLPVLLAAGLLEPAEGRSKHPSLELAVNTAAFTLLPFLLFARTVELMVDLTTRYW